MKHIYKSSSNTYNYNNSIYLKPTYKEYTKLLKKVNLKSYQRKYLNEMKSLTRKYYYIQYLINKQLGGKQSVHHKEMSFVSSGAAEQLK